MTGAQINIDVNYEITVNVSNAFGDETAQIWKQNFNVQFTI